METEVGSQQRHEQGLIAVSSFAVARTRKIPVVNLDVNEKAQIQCLPARREQFKRISEKPISNLSTVDIL